MAVIFLKDLTNLNEDVRGENVAFSGSDVKQSSGGGIVDLLTDGVVEAQQLQDRIQIGIKASLDQLVLLLLQI